MDSVDSLFHPDLLAKYSANGPRYTSYPTALQFRDDFDTTDYFRAASDTGASASELSLYFHVPFCDTVCFYCGCTKVVTKNRARSHPYLQRMKRELALHAARFDTARPVTQLHLGGGTPTFLPDDQLSELMAAAREHFTLVPDAEAEYSIEVDPREANPKTIIHLRSLGFNRLSIGVQDFDPVVQTAVNRVQPFEMTADVMRAAHASGFKSISIDLIYGLPHQTVDSFNRTLDKVLKLAPDRLSVFGYAHLPQLFKMQRRIDPAAMPSPAQRLAILRQTIQRLTSAGYVYIGMDHFALPTDELARAQAKGTLHRNFQGYSTHADCDLIGIGASSIGKVGDVYVQNVKDLPGYAASIDAGGFAIGRGIRLSADDRLRRDIITQLMCNLELRYDEIEVVYGIRFAQAFASELERLAGFEADGLVSLDSRKLEVLPAGRMLVRNIAMVFDRYAGQQPITRFSRTI
jgi:oxygen-independent coproporphyrinogen-3 oxidase